VAALVGQLESEGAIDFVDGSQGSYYALPVMLPGMEYPMASMLGSSGTIVNGAKRIPRILTAARIRTLEEAEQLLRDGSGDLIVMNRAFIADPYLLQKTRAGREDEVRCCIACNQGCVGGLLSPANRLGCTINPAVGFERTLNEELIRTVAVPRNVLVVGGGPAGMEAARTAAMSGHRVTLVEARADLGGGINLAAQTPRLQNLADYTQWQEREIRRLGVEVSTGSYFEEQDVLEANPDAVIIATGSVPRMDGRQCAAQGQPIKGAELPHVVSCVDLLTGAVRSLPKTALILDDTGHNEALATAQWLSERDVAITFVTRFMGLSPVVESWTRVEAALRHLLKGAFRVMPRAQLLEIRAGEASVRPLQGETAETVPAELVVLVLPRQPVNDLAKALQGKVQELRVVGDARTPRDLQAAVREAHLAGRTLFGAGSADSRSAVAGLSFA
jgi:thioredoxin reductase